MIMNCVITVCFSFFFFPPLHGREEKTQFSMLSLYINVLHLFSRHMSHQPFGQCRRFWSKNQTLIKGKKCGLMFGPQRALISSKPPFLYDFLVTATVWKYFDNKYIFRQKSPVPRTQF